MHTGQLKKSVAGSDPKGPMFEKSPPPFYAALSPKT